MGNLRVSRQITHEAICEGGVVVVGVEGGTDNGEHCQCGVGGLILVWDLYNRPWIFGSGDKGTESEI